IQRLAAELAGTEPRPDSFQPRAVVLHLVANHADRLSGSPAYNQRVSNLDADPARDGTVAAPCQLVDVAPLEQVDLTAVLAAIRVFTADNFENAGSHAR